ncbi:hypothetical protein COU75_04940 [Candidatus Peregrinibacteria bacterium CG10_big_fil_rev_8_21_14_0_10_42_8]|nr:MAG: hypothetical protein COU75_04940 [Candidatus Peregrinibacteria bacterium CG10_big_fil_rev_8_21_14_0_10_42_8]
MKNSPERFFPGPQGSEGLIVVPMTDFTLRDPHRTFLPKEVIDLLMENTGRARQRLQSQHFAGGDKIAAEIDIEQVARAGIALRLHGGPTLQDDFSYKFMHPHTPHTKRKNPKTFEELLESTTINRMGGNIANMFRSKIQLALAGLGAENQHAFMPADKFLQEWLEQKLDKLPNDTVSITTLENMSSRIGVAYPYMGEKGPQPFSFNKPQPGTIDPMRPHVRELKELDYVIASEGLGEILKTARVNIKQLFNPTSALHNESALELIRRRSEGAIQDRTMVNSKEMNDWIRVMENRLYEIPTSEIPDAHFPDVFQNGKIDTDAVHLVRESHARIGRIMRVPETEYVDFVAGIGCGPDGGQNQFQAEGRHYVACSTTLNKAGAKNLIELCGKGCGLDINIGDAVGAGDAAYTAATMGILYGPEMNSILEKKCPNMSKERKRIAAMAFTTILQRVFGELAFRSHNRDLSQIKPAAFIRIFDTTLEKAIAAAQKIVQTSRMPEEVYSDKEWGIDFAVMELDS